MNSSDRILAVRYARAYLNLDGLDYLAKTEKTAREQVSQLTRLQEEIKPIEKFLLHPALPFDGKVEIFRKAKFDLSGNCPGFIELLLKENRFYLISAIIEEAGRIVDGYAGIVRALASSKTKIDEAEIEKLEKALGAIIDKKVMLSQSIDEAIIGGIKIKMDDLFVDASLNGRINKLKKEILN
ncbi:MAG: ATP synthase F1 subunit delta [Elusimicrobiales bacterium]|nr:ATP synthase F1 subunit delta [Elusimicrobiales bacterium]